MANDQATQRQAVFVQDQVAHLLVHGFDDAPGGFGVVRGFGVLPGHFAVPELEVRHIDVHNAVHQLHGLERVIRAGVVDQRKAQATLDGQRQGFQDLWHHVLRGHEIDVVATLLLQPQHHGG